MKNLTINQKVQETLANLKTIKAFNKYCYTDKKKSDKTPLYIARSTTDANKISYITRQKINALKEHIDGFKFTASKEIRNKYFFHTSPAKLLQKFINEDIKWNDVPENGYLKDLERFIYNDVTKSNKIELKCYTGVDIGLKYNTTDHEIIGSCMQEKPTKYFELYENFEDKLKLYTIERDGTMIARALLWSVTYADNEHKYLDRIYTNTDDNQLKKNLYNDFFLKVVKAENYPISRLYNANHLNYECKELKEYIENTNRNLRTYPSFDDIVSGTDLNDLDYFPYMDTFQYVTQYGDLNTDEGVKKLNCTCGEYTDTSKTCECCGCDIDEDNTFYTEDTGEERCEDCVRWSNVDDVYYSEENVTYIGGNVESYVCNDDIH